MLLNRCWPIGFCLQRSCADHMTGKISEHPRTWWNHVCTWPSHPGGACTSEGDDTWSSGGTIGSLRIQILQSLQSFINLSSFKPCFRQRHFSHVTFVFGHAVPKTEGYVSDPSLDRMPLRSCARFRGGSGIWLFFKFCDLTPIQWHLMSFSGIQSHLALSQTCARRPTQVPFLRSFIDRYLKRSQCHSIGFLTAIGFQGVHFQVVSKSIKSTFASSQQKSPHCTGLLHHKRLCSFSVRAMWNLWDSQELAAESWNFADEWFNAKFKSYLKFGGQNFCQEEAPPAPPRSSVFAPRLPHRTQPVRITTLELKSKISRVLPQEFSKVFSRAFSISCRGGFLCLENMFTLQIHRATTVKHRWCAMVATNRRILCRFGDWAIR